MLGLLPDKVKFCWGYIISSVFPSFLPFPLPHSHSVFLSGFHLHIQGKKFGVKSICQALVKDAKNE